MKKTILFLGVLSIFMGKSMAQNQPLPDGKFEQWEQGTTDRGESYDDLANPFWKSLNVLATLPPEMSTGPVTLFKDKGRSGADNDFAPMMKSNTLMLADKEIFLPGVVGAMTVVTEKQTATFGRPFTSRPDAIKGYMKYEPVNGDSASIFVEVYKYNEAAGIRQMIGRVEKFFKESVKDWTVFELPIVYNADITPDSITVLFVSSAGYRFDSLFECKGQVGSTLWVDDVEFVYKGSDPSTNNENPVLASSKLYPNPSFNGIFNLNVKAACKMEVISVSGQLVMQQNLATPGAYTVDLSRFAPGVYYIRLSNKQGSASLKAVRR